MKNVWPVFAAFCLLGSACVPTAGEATGNHPASGTGGSAGQPATSGGKGGDSQKPSGGDGGSGGGGTATGGASGGSGGGAGSDGNGGAPGAEGGAGGGGVDEGGASGQMGGAGGQSGGGTGGSATDAGMNPQDGGAPDTKPSTGGGINLSMWGLELPTGSGNSPEQVSAKNLPQFSNMYFSKAADGGYIFSVPQTGITYSASLHPRTEMHEANAAGTGVSWSASGTNSMTVTGKGLKGSRVTIAQVFNGTGGIPLCELEYSPTGFELLYEEARSAGNYTALGVASPYGTQYTFTLALSKNVLTATINGKVVYTHTISGAVSGSKFFFKVGNYDQKATKGAVSQTILSSIENYSISVTHQ